MYTEKVTLRLKPEDKNQYQTEADNKGLTLTTYLRSKIMGVEFEEDEEETPFERQPIYYNQSAHQHAIHNGNKAIQLYGNVIAEIEKLGLEPNTNEDKLRMLKNPVGYLNEEIERKYRPGINIPISTLKLIDLLEINVEPFMTAYGKFTQHPSHKLLMVNNEGEIIVNQTEEMHTTYTSNEGENERLSIVKNFIEDFYTMFTNYTGNIYSDASRNFIELMKGKVIHYNGKLYPNAYYVVNGNDY